MTKVSEISEFDLISRLETILENNVTPNKDSKVELSIGDDAAVIGNLDNLQVVTTDAMVDKVHFVSDQVDMRSLGWKSLAVNYSDIASMGCKPIYSVVTLGLRADISVEQLENLYLGFSDLLNTYGGDLVGGDIVKSDTFFISVTVVGSTDKPETMQRKTAVPGDAIRRGRQPGQARGAVGVVAFDGRELGRATGRRARHRARSGHPAPRRHVQQRADRQA